MISSVQKDLAKLEKHREIWQFQEKRYEEYLRLYEGLVSSPLLANT